MLLSIYFVIALMILADGIFKQINSREEFWATGLFYNILGCMLWPLLLLNIVVDNKKVGKKWSK